jgi:hypothetical protein
LEDEEDMLNAIEKSSTELTGFNIAQALFNYKTTWDDIAKILQSVEKGREEPEAIRRIVLGYANSILLKGGKLSDKAMLVINSFRDNFFNSNQAGLTAACYEIIVLGK